MVCFIIIHPPRSILFPYTTLFRSSCPLAHGARPDALKRFLLFRYSPSLVARLQPTGAVGPQEPEQTRDRKSTRLNSSHGYSSYAVFCLKKKKIVAADRRRHSRFHN